MIGIRYQSIKVWNKLSVAFDKKFSSIPTVVICLYENANIIDRRLFISCHNVTQDGFDIWYYSESQTGTSSICWIATS